MIDALLMSALHPMPVLLAFFLGAIAAAALSPPGAALAVGCYLAFGLWRHPWRPVAERAGRQLWRLKWLFLATLAFIAWPVPGRALAEGWPDFLPTREGLQLGLLQSGRLAAVILLYAALPAALDLPQRTAGLCRLLQAFGSGGRRLALRLALTLHALEGMRASDCWTVLREPSEAMPRVAMSIPDPPAMDASDRGLCALALVVFVAAALLGVWFRPG